MYSPELDAAKEIVEFSEALESQHDRLQELCRFSPKGIVEVSRARSLVA